MEHASFEIHPAADIFPMMSASEFAELKADIKQHGVREPIVIFDNRLIDGRNRYKAMQELGIDPGYHAADLEVCDDPIAFVLSHNLHRRHLTTSQRAAIAAEVAKLRVGVNQHTKEGPSNDGASVKEAAKALSVGTASVERAKQVASKGDKTVTEKVKQGELPVSLAAKLVEAVPDKKEQKKIVEQGKEAVQKAVKKAAADKPQKTSPAVATDAQQQSAFTVPEPDRDVLCEFIPFWNGLTAKQRRTIKVWIREQDDN